MPTVDEKLFKLYDWIDIYHHATDPVPGNMPEARGLSVSISMFVDASHGANVKDCQSQTGVLIFINKAPIHWYIKKQPSVETSKFDAEFCAMKVGFGMVEALQYKLKKLGYRLMVQQTCSVTTKRYIKTPSCLSQPSGRSITTFLTTNVGKRSQLR